MRNGESATSVISRHRQILYTFLTGLLMTLPLWSEKVYYRDDFFRIVNGQANLWISNGRPLTWLINVALRFNTSVNDISPLPLLMGLAILAAASVIYAEKLALPLRGYWQLLPAQFMILNPFLAQSLLYSYDSLTMMLSLAMAMMASLPFRFSRTNKILLTAGLMLLVLTTYQTGLNVYLGCCAIITFRLWVNREAIWPYIGEKMAAGLIAAVLYKVIIVAWLVTDPYSLAHSKMIPPGPAAFATLLQNVDSFTAMVLSAFPGYKVLLIAIPLLSATLGLLILLVRTAKAAGSARRKIFNGLAIVLLPFLAIAAIPGLSLLLSDPVISPRVLIAWSCFSLFCFCVNILAFPAIRRWVQALTLLPLFYFLVLMISAFNTVANDQRYTANLLQRMKIDLSHIPPQDVKNIAFIDQPADSPDIIISLRNFPLIKAIRLPMLMESAPWEYQVLALRENIALRLTPTLPEMKTATPAYLSQDCVYKLFLYQQTAVFDFRTGPCR